MRDLIGDLQYALNDNKLMNAHPLISASANEIVRLNCELEQVKFENQRLKSIILNIYKAIGDKDEQHF